MTSRRTFLQRTSAAAAAGLLTRWPGGRLWALSPSELLPEPDEALLRELALTAIDAARAAGAGFADVRLAVARGIEISGSTWGRGRGTSRGWPDLTRTAGYGVRAIVDGAWGFASGHELTADAVATAARTAVAGARTNRPRRPRTLELAPTSPVANGVWSTPMEQDPLTVPIGEQAELVHAALATVEPNPAVTRALLKFQWRRPTTVFAATDGTFILQRLATALPAGFVRGSAGEGNSSLAQLEVTGLRVGGYGYEAVGAATLPDEMRRTAERAIALARAARSPVSAEVGRYDLVFGPSAVAELLTTMAGAVDLARALGYEANGVGTSFAAPPLEILGRYQVASELVSVHADRTQVNGAATVGWDEEGVEPADYTFIKDGVIVDYHTDRQTAMELTDWYRSQGRPVRAHGGARRTGTKRPVIVPPNLTMAPGPGATTVDDLIADTRRGFYIERGGGSADQQLLNTQGRVGHTMVRRITNGKLGEYVRDFAFQFITPEFWKRVDGIGGAGSDEARAISTDVIALAYRLQPFPASTVRTVPMRVRQVNILNVGMVMPGIHTTPVAP